MTINQGLMTSNTDMWSTPRAFFDDYNDIKFIRGRLKFGGSKNSAPFPSAVVFQRS